MTVVRAALLLQLGVAVIALITGTEGTSVLPSMGDPAATPPQQQGMLPGRMNVIPAPTTFRFATACGVANCSQCSFDSSKECIQCAAGHFAFKYSYDALSKAPLCLACDGLGCAEGACKDQQGCAACPAGSVLTTDLEVKSSPKGSLILYSLPARCQHCTEDLGCATCADGLGCTSCPHNHIAVVTPQRANYTHCVDCAQLGCAACEDGVGCTSCPQGSFLYADGADGLVSCQSCSQLNCKAEWCVDNQGCSECPPGFVLSQNLSAAPFPPVRCLNCITSLQCQECDGQQGCKSCPYGMYLKGVKAADLYPRTQCASCDELGCATCGASQGCLTCPDGYFLDTSTVPNTCEKCASVLNCASCDASGCKSCPRGSFLTQSLIYPGKQECSQCQGCTTCNATSGCEACMLDYFWKATPSPSPSKNGSASQNCAGCDDGIGCTSCLEGSYLYNDTVQGITTCRSCAQDLNCALCGDAGCKTCPFGYYRCTQTLAGNNQTVTGCCPCTGCAKCQDFQGCTACPYNYTLAPLDTSDPFNTCRGANCTAASRCIPCADEDTSDRGWDVSSSGLQAFNTGTKPQQCNTCPAGQFLADPTAPFLDCRDCSAWLGCTSCGEQGCTSCPTGAYLAAGSTTFGPNITACTACRGCRPEACADHYGCLSCPGNFTMTYGSAPLKRCYDCSSLGLNCASCSNDQGCTACPSGYFLDRSSADSPWYCSSCQHALGCSTCSSDAGCTSCPAGYTLAKLGKYWAGVFSCVPALSGGGGA